MPKSDGYWFTMDNVENCSNCYEQTKQWIQTNNLNVKTIGFDLEIDYRNLQELNNASWSELFTSILTRTPERLAFAEKTLISLANQVKSDGFFLETYLLAFLYDERKEGSSFLRQLLGLVDVPNVNREVPMLYSTGGMYGRGIMSSYGNESNEIGIGITGGAGSQGGNVYTNFSQFQRDLLYTWNNLTQRNPNTVIEVYSFEGCVDNNYLEPLLDFDWNQSVSEIDLYWFSKEQQIVDQVRIELQQLLNGTTDPIRFLEWLEQNPTTAVSEIFQLIIDWIEWNSGFFPTPLV